MKIFRYLPCSLILGIASASFGGQGFQGLELSAGLERSKYKLPGAEVYNAGIDQAYSTFDASDKRSGSKLGVSYGFVGKNYVTSIGIDYIKTNQSLSTEFNGTSTSTSGPITQTFKNRYEVYIAPGFKLTRATLAYVKIGVMDTQNKIPLDSSANTTLTGGPNTLGALYGAGIKQKFTDNSPYFLKIEYTGGQSKNGTTLDALGNQYQSKLKYGSASASLGLNF